MRRLGDSRQTPSARKKALDGAGAVRCFDGIGLRHRESGALVQPDWDAGRNVCGNGPGNSKRERDAQHDGRADGQLACEVWVIAEQDVALRT